MSKPDIDFVEATEDEDGRWTVTPHWTGGVDHPANFGWAGLKPDVADRLIAAIIDGAVFSNAQIAVNNYGETYVKFDRKVYGKYANADLRKIGY